MSQIEKRTNWKRSARYASTPRDKKSARTKASKTGALTTIFRIVLHPHNNAGQPCHFVRLHDQTISNSIILFHFCRVTKRQQTKIFISLQVRMHAHTVGKGSHVTCACANMRVCSYPNHRTSEAAFILVCVGHDTDKICPWAKIVGCTHFVGLGSDKSRVGGLTDFSATSTIYWSTDRQIEVEPSSTLCDRQIWPRAQMHVLYVANHCFQSRTKLLNHKHISK